MAQIPRRLIDNYTAGINGLSENAKSQLSKMLERIDYSDIAAAREAITEAFKTVCGEYAAITSDFSAAFYGEVREMAIGEYGDVVNDYEWNPEPSEESIRAFMQDAVEGNPDKTAMKVLARLDYEIKKSAARSVVGMGGRDSMRVRFARVPSGIETCSFCLMLASRGFVYISKDSAGAVRHYHPNCDCRIVPGFDGLTEIEGYDPNFIYDQWMNSIEDEARARSERNGTDMRDELKLIKKRYSESAKRSRSRKKDN